MEQRGSGKERKGEEENDKVITTEYTRDFIIIQMVH